MSVLGGTKLCQFVFTLKGFNLEETDLDEKLYDAGCDDATIWSTGGRIYASFAREATSLEEAIESAKQDVAKAGGEVLSVDSDF